MPSFFEKLKKGMGIEQPIEQDFKEEMTAISEKPVKKRTSVKRTRKTGAKVALKEISTGKSLSTAFKSSKLFPELVINIIAIGEETGSLDKSLMGIARDYEGEVSRTLKEITRLLEPVIILVMGLVVGFIVLSMLELANSLLSGEKEIPHERSLCPLSVKIFFPLFIFHSFTLKSLLELAKSFPSGEKTALYSHGHSLSNGSPPTIHSYRSIFIPEL